MPLLRLSLLTALGLLARINNFRNIHHNANNPVGIRVFKAHFMENHIFSTTVFKES